MNLLRYIAFAALLIGTGHAAMATEEVSKITWNGGLLAQRNPQEGARVSIGSATELVQRQTGGRVLTAQPVRQDGREGYRIKVLTRSGEVRVFFVDAHSGAMQQD